MLLAAVAIVLLTWRFTRELNTYGIGEDFARPMKVSLPEWSTDLSAKSCGECHVAIYQEWQQTMHAQAWTDPYFQTDWVYDKEKQNCLNCHTPLEDQQPDLVVGFEDGDYWSPITEKNPEFDPELQQEGVTCAVCHIKEGKIIGPHGIEDAPHPVAQDLSMASGMGVCRRCHAAPPAEEWGTTTISLCGTVEEIGLEDKEPDCIGCHMPRVTRALAPGYPEREGRLHQWQGGHTPSMVRKALRVDLEPLQTTSSRRGYVVKLTNVGAYHYLPTGTPDRHLVLNVEVSDGEGRIAYEETHRLIRRILWRPIIIDWSDTRLPYQETREYPFQFRYRKVRGPYSVDIRVDYHLLEPWRQQQIGYQPEGAKSYTVYRNGLAIR